MRYKRSKALCKDVAERQKYLRSTMTLRCFLVHLSKCRMSKEIEADFEFFDQQLRPLLFAFSDLSLSKSAFQVHLRRFGRALKERRAKNLRAHEEDLEVWAAAVRDIKGS